MPTELLNEREFELINIIGAELASNQRDLSRHMALSLGATNMLLRRLIAKGYIRIRQLNKKKVEYILTSAGFTEKMKKSIKYTLKTINSIGLIKGQLRKLLKKVYEGGERKFYIFGEHDLASLVETVMRELSLQDCTFFRIQELPDQELDGTLLICREDVPEKILAKKKIDLLHELAKDSFMLNENHGND